MTDEKIIRILKNALINILADASYCENPLPIIKATAKSALDETNPPPITYPKTVHCPVHNWYGEGDDRCPLCKHQISLGV